jgi:crossover junction endodeoxyribonuclease RuvC
MVILGIDPGIANTGYGVIEIDGEEAKLITYGAFHTSADEKKEIRLAQLFEKISELMTKHKPDAVSIELLFFNRNTKTALQVGEARGVVLLATGLQKRDLFEYTPLQVKECLTGYGRTKKNSVREVVQMELNMDKPPKPIDASDALALALTHNILQGMDEDFL